MKNGSLLIASTRLPVSVAKENGKLKYKQSTGGLATGMSYVSKSRDSVWIGWPGIASDELSPKEKKEITAELAKRDCVPVFLTQQQLDTYYSGYCNATLWPLFHYFANTAIFSEDYWDSYKEVNTLFAREINKHIQPNTQVWVHDYQLMLVPKMLRDKRPKAEIGFFLHTPFPSYEIFRMIPEREELLCGLLGADLVGFHTYDYVRHFLSSVRRSVGYESQLGTIQLEDRIVQADAFPIGIDYNLYAKSSKKRSIKKKIDSFNIDKKMKVILAVDRADYSKGIPERLDAYELFLEKNPEYHEKVVFIVLAAPSRENVEAYQELREDIELRVSRINGTYSTVDWSPITYFHQSLPTPDVTALYSIADVALITPLRDGMNLVAKEYVATRQNGQGVLILSEMAGVASEVPEALQVNPRDAHMVADAIKRALEMPKREQKQYMKQMKDRFSEYTIARWASDFVTMLDKAHNRPRSTKYLDEAAKQELFEAYKNAEKKLLLLDYDGTLREFVKSPSAKLAKPPIFLLNTLRRLTKRKDTNVTIISGRPKNILNSFFKGITVDLVAEHGGWIMKAGRWVSSVTDKRANRKWKKQAMEVLKDFEARTPGSQIEKKDFSIVWHYRNVSPELAFVRAEELRMELISELADTGIGVFSGNKVIEVKPERMHKGAIASDIISSDTWDFILSAGDDYTDEDMFAVMPDHGFSINIGNGETKARYQLASVGEFRDLLNELSKIK